MSMRKKVGKEHVPERTYKTEWDAIKMLFDAKWNIPQAAKHCGLSHDDMKKVFNTYCHINGTTYNKFTTNVQLSLDI